MNTTARTWSRRILSSCVLIIAWLVEPCLVFSEDVPAPSARVLEDYPYVIEKLGKFRTQPVDDFANQRSLRLDKYDVRNRRIVKFRSESYKWEIVPLPGSHYGVRYDGWWLNYDHLGKDPLLGLVAEPGPGTEWKAELPRDDHGVGPKGGIVRRFLHLRAVNGPYHDWIPCRGEKDLILQVEDAVKKKEAYEARFYYSLTASDPNDGK